MKKQFFSLALFAAAWLAGGSALAQAQFDASKLYTIESNNNAGKYMQDNGDGYIVTGALNANSYWKFETTGNDGCYYVKNAKTGKYMQKTSEYQVSVKTGNTSVEIYIKNDPAKGETVYGMASTDRNPHDFANDNTYGANYKSGTVQGFHAALGATARPNSFWKIIGHSFTNGVCSDNNCTEKYQAPALVDGWYELTNAGNVEWIGDYVQNTAVDPKVKMMNDIDFKDVSFRMIGRNSGRKFNGVFDGQGHRIKNLTLENVTEDANSVLGFFAWVRGGSTIKNLIMDSSCSFHGYKRVSAFVGVTQANIGGAVNILNCVNEATVTANDNPAGAFVGCRNPSNNDTPQIIIDGCVNIGTITAKSETAAFVGWANRENNNVGWDNHIVRNSYNFGTINNIDGKNRGFFRSDNISIVNSYDFGSNKANNNQKTSFTWTKADPVASGELAYHLNQVAEAQVLYQTFGTDDYPVPFNTHGTVYVSAELRCDGNPVEGGEAIYSNNDSGATIPPHTPGTNGFCTVCGKNPVKSLTQDGDDYLLVSNAAELEYLSSVVNSAGGSTKKVKLTADIDMDGVTHTPIGYNNNNKFCGEFDGQGKRILNMKSYSQNTKVGVFGALKGGTLVKNLIVDASCQITGVNHLGGIAGSCQTKNNSNVTVENCINEASIHGTGYGVGGIIGQNESGDLPVNIINCGNSGSIQADDANACAVIGWAGGANADITINNFWNTGKIIKGKNDKLVRDDHEGDALAFNFFNAKQAAMDNNIHLTNCYDASPTEARSQGIPLDASAATSGELTYRLGSVWKQLIGTDTHPVFDGSEVFYVGNAGYSTMYDADNDWELVGDAQAYIGTINGSALHLDEIGDIPAGTAVVISGTYYNKVSTAATASTTGNVLLGSDGTKTGGEGIYALAIKNEKVGFYPVAASVTIPAGKAYLEYTSTGGNAVKGFTFVFDEDDATGISLMEDGRSQMEDGAIYNIAGQRINKMQRGINIVNGKKIMK